MTGDVNGDDPWGLAVAPAVAEADLEPLPPALADIEAMLEIGEDRVLAPGERLTLPGLADLPEIASLTPEGWEPLPTGFMGFEWALLPAIWPGEHRRWVRDRMPCFGLMSYGDEETRLGPESGRDTHQRWMLARMARSVGLPPPPPDRIWLLRSPWATLPVSSLLLAIGQHRDRNGFGWDSLANMRAAQDLLSRSEDEVWDLWTGRQAEAARSWVGSERGLGAERWIRLGLGPGHVQTLLEPLEAGGAGLDPDQARAWSEVIAMREEPGDDVVLHVIDWRRAGLPADADVERLGMVLLDRDPDDVAQWLASGLVVDDVAVWQGEDLDRARRWRDAGFGAREARELVLADPTLTPEEARAFDAAGITPSARHRWVAAGFTPEQAREWTDLDIVASEARVWRSLDMGPDEARAQRASGGGALPVGVELGWAAMGSDRDDVSYGVTDPPGTRGGAANIGPDGTPHFP